jgi:hypothetical protein
VRERERCEEEREEEEKRERERVKRPEGSRRADAAATLATGRSFESM